MKQFPLFKLCIIYSFSAGLAAYRVIGRKMLQAFVNMIKFPQELSLLNLVSGVRYQELSKSIQNSEQGFVPPRLKWCILHSSVFRSCIKGLLWKKTIVDARLIGKYFTSVWLDQKFYRQYFSFLSLFIFLIASICRLKRLRFPEQELVLRGFYATKNIERV